MMPIEMLMTEHRLIERMIRVMASAAEKARRENRIDADFVGACIDFIRTYADKCHHGKEEKILFRDAAKKPLSADLRGILDELLSEHDFGRRTVGQMEKAKERYKGGDAAALAEIERCIDTLVEFYPKHIEKEDKHFFSQSMKYFDKAEQDDMLRAFLEYDRGLIHEVYGKITERFETEIT